MSPSRCLLLVWYGLATALVASVLGQTQATMAERGYPQSQARVKKALQELGAYQGDHLPALESFVSPGTQQLERFTRPYYQFQVELVGLGAERTLVRVKANVSAWYTDPQTGHSEYRALISNGHLESDLLDRLEDYFKSTASDLDAQASSLEDKIVAVGAQREALEKQKTELTREIASLEAALRTQQTPVSMAWVTTSGAPVLASPDSTSFMLRAEKEDEFEVVEERGEWLRVRLSPRSTGWLRRSETAEVAGAGRGLLEQKVTTTTSEFVISREDVNEFSGDWAALKGKQALFVYARTLGVLPESTLAGKKLAYAKQVFAERYRQAAHSQQQFAGVVVIFVGNKGGVAAATFGDIREWVEGGLPETSFLKHCSLDPPEAFHELRTR